MKKIIIVLYLSLSGLWATLFSPDMLTNVVVAAETIKVAAIMAKSGEAIQQLEGDTTPALVGIRYAIEDINKQGGVLGKQIELLEFDNKSMAIGAKLAAEEAVKAGVVAILGDVWSSHSLAVAPVAQAAKIPMISPMSTNPKVTLVGDYIFRVCFIDPFQGLVMANFAVDDLKAKSAVVLTNTTEAYSMGLADFFKDKFKQKGGEILWEGDYLSKTTDFTALLEKIKSLNPNVIFIPGAARESSYIIKQSREMGIKSTFLGGDAWFEAMWKYSGDAVEGSYYSSHWHPDIANELSKKFIQDHNYTSAKAGVTLGYDAGMLLADAIRRANSFEPTQIRNAIASTQNFQGLTGKISFDSNRDPIKSAVILKFEKKKIVYYKSVEP
ncbi:MAG: ABC transporter substrate-binding protein [Desulfamplus sp.]|nr:ABC transporter substrate-binding protein [Desulfamplus sp.]